jgi:Fe-S-cluster containining protein
VRPLPLLPAAGSCNGCGDCCRAVGLHISTAERERRWRWADWYAQGWDFYDGPDAEARGREYARQLRWQLFELVPITPEEAMRRLPSLPPEEALDPKRSWHWCRNFDPETNQCGVQDDKPWACSGFPWYQLPVMPDLLRAYPNCGYHRDVARAGVHIERGAE